MTIYALEMRSTENWNDVRYREYTTSERKAIRFKQLVPRIGFTDSGHGIVPTVKEVPGRNLQRVYLLTSHVRKAMASTTESDRKPKDKDVIRDLLAAARKALNFVENTESELGVTLDSGDALRAAIAKASPSPTAVTGGDSPPCPVSDGHP